MFFSILNYTNIPEKYKINSWKGNSSTFIEYFVHKKIALCMLESVIFKRLT